MSCDLSVIVHQRARRIVYSFVSVMCVRSADVQFLHDTVLGPNYLLSPMRSNVTSFPSKEIHYCVFGLY